LKPVRNLKKIEATNRNFNYQDSSVVLLL